MSISEKAAFQLRQGKAVIIYDGDEREAEADIVIHAGFVAPETIRMLRKDAGGLICLALDEKIARMLKLPFYTDILAGSDFEVSRMECKKTAYNDKPSFSIPVNHKEVFTGITDNDRALTINKMAELVVSNGSTDEIFEKFACGFYSPGHVSLLIGRGIKERKGHTELSLELAKKAGLSGAMVLCEMLGKGRALAKADVIRYAQKHSLSFIKGSDIDESAGH